MSLNTPDVRTAGHYQRGSIEGSVGHPLPRVLVDVVDPESGELLLGGETGDVLMRGPGVASPWGGSRPDVVRLGHRGRMDERGFLFLEAGPGSGPRSSPGSVPATPGDP